MQGLKVGTVSEHRHRNLDGADKNIPIPVKHIGDLRGQSSGKPKQTPPAIPPSSPKDPPGPPAGVHKRVRSFKIYYNRDTSHPDEPRNVGIGVQPTFYISDYSRPEYDYAVHGPPPFEHSPTYDWYFCLIIPAAKEMIWNVYCKWKDEFKSYKERNWRFVAGLSYPPDMIIYLTTIQPPDHPRPDCSRREVAGGEESTRFCLMRFCAIGQSLVGVRPLMPLLASWESANLATQLTFRKLAAMASKKEAPLDGTTMERQVIIKPYMPMTFHPEAGCRTRTFIR